MVVSEIRLFELLNARIGEKEAEAFVEILENKVDKKFEDRRGELASKEDLIKEIGAIALEGRKRAEKLGIQESDVAKLVQRVRKSKR